MFANNQKKCIVVLVLILSQIVGEVTNDHVPGSYLAKVLTSHKLCILICILKITSRHGIQLILNSNGCSGQ